MKTEEKKPGSPKKSGKPELQPNNKIIPLRLTNVIVENYETDMNIMDEDTQIYGTAMHGNSSKITFKNGNMYQGRVEFGMLQGEGVFTWTNGVIYKGQFEKNRITGKGRYEWPDESWFEGDVVDGLRNGQGNYESPKDGIKYQGNWVDGMRQGHGQLEYKSGSIYEGNFQKGYKEGHGIMTYLSGNRYDGNWKHNKKDGFGTMFWTVNTNEKYYGIWKDNKQNGFGVHIWIEDRGENKYFRNRYEGYWLNGERHGLGVFYYANGAKYEGQWKHNLKDGFAFFSFENGKEFKGLFKNDRMFKEDGMNGPQSIQSMEDVKISEKKQGKNKKTKGGGKKKTVDIQPNPYNDFLDLSDMLVNKYNSNFTLMKVQNLLLRQNTNLRNWYKTYSPHADEKHPEESFSMTTRHFWKFIREARILNSSLSIATFNRLFVKGSKNHFDLKCDFRRLVFRLKNLIRDYKEKKVSMKQKTLKLVEEVQEEVLLDDDEKPEKLTGRSDRKTPSPELPEKKVEILTEIKEEDTESKYDLEIPEGLQDQPLKRIEMHDPHRVMLFRHFTDALVRVGYLKYGRKIENLSQQLEEMFLTIIRRMFDQTNTTSTSKNRMKYMDFIELQIKLMIQMQDVFTAKHSLLIEIFCRYLVKPQTRDFESVDLTIECRDVIKLFQDSGIVDNPEKLSMLYRVLERHHDISEDFSHVAGEVKKIDKELKKLENKTGDRSTKLRIKYQNKKDEKLILMDERLMLLYNTEITFHEFKEILVIYFLKKDAESKKSGKKGDKLKSFFKKKLKEFIEGNKRKCVIKRLKDNRTWKRTEKDFLKDRLEERLEEERLRRLAQQKKAEEESKENREREYMKDNDYNITSDIEMANNQDDEESSEESNF